MEVHGAQFKIFRKGFFVLERLLDFFVVVTVCCVARTRLQRYVRDFEPEVMSVTGL